MAKPFIATVELGGPFKILAKQIWIKAEDRTSPPTGDLIAVKSVVTDSSETEGQAGNLINHSGLANRDGDSLEEHSVNPAHMWRSAKGETSCWLEFDLGQVQALGRHQPLQLQRRLAYRSGYPQGGYLPLDTGVRLEEDPGRPGDRAGPGR